VSHSTNVVGVAEQEVIDTLHVSLKGVGVRKSVIGAYVLSASNVTVLDSIERSIRWLQLDWCMKARGIWALMNSGASWWVQLMGKADDGAGISVSWSFTARRRLGASRIEPILFSAADKYEPSNFRVICSQSPKP